MTQKINYPLRRAIPSIMLTVISGGSALLLGSVACDDHGYRANVHSTGETRFDIQNVKEDPSEKVYTKSAAHPNGLKDEDLEDVVNAWPKLNPADKKRLAAQARKMAGIPD